MAFKNGLRLPVSIRDAFPHGCCVVPDSITEAMDHNEATHTRSPALDKQTGQPVYSCWISDLAGRSREVVVKILADKMPVPPTRPPSEPVEFAGLTVTPTSTTATARAGAPGAKRGWHSRCGAPDRRHARSLSGGQCRRIGLLSNLER